MLPNWENVAATKNSFLKIYIKSNVVDKYIPSNDSGLYKKIVYNTNITIANILTINVEYIL